MNLLIMTIRHLQVEFRGYDWATDNYCISYHGFTVSHMDGLAHLGQNGKLYNDYDATKITTRIRRTWNRGF